jgi:hypothetical protein
MSTTRYPIESPELLLRQDHYTPEELADLLGMTVSHVRQAARCGDLAAFLIDHHVVTIRREDALRWLSDRRAASH